jgi:hypothetical protein
VIASQLIIANLEGPGTYAFKFFPENLQTSRRVVWEPQDVTIGTKPLQYGNRDPKRISFNEVWLDNTDTGESIAPDIAALFALQNEIPKIGRPPALLAAWGDRQERCVLEEISVTETFFSGLGEPLRATVAMQFVELQKRMESTDVVVTEVEEGAVTPFGFF